MKIYTPVKDVNGMYASVQFVNGVGETNDLRLIEWFRKHGYRVENNVNYIKEVKNDVIDRQNEAIESLNKMAEPNFDDMTPNELRSWMVENGYGSKIKNTRNKEKLLEIIRG